MEKVPALGAYASHHWSRRFVQGCAGLTAKHVLPAGEACGKESPSGKAAENQPVIRGINSAGRPELLVRFQSAEPCWQAIANGFDEAAGKLAVKCEGLPGGSQCCCTLKAAARLGHDRNTQQDGILEALEKATSAGCGNPFGFHALRHKSAAIVYGAQGLQDAQRLLGHYRASTTDRYVKSAGLYTNQEGILEALNGSAIGKVAGSLVAKANIRNVIPKEKDPRELAAR